MSRSCRLPLAGGAAPSAPIVSESEVSGRPFATRGSPECTSKLLLVPAVGEPWPWYPPGSLPLPDRAIPMPPLPLDRVVDGFRVVVAVVVVPQPR